MFRTQPLRSSWFFGCVLTLLVALRADAGAPRPGLIAPYGYDGIVDRSGLIERDSFGADRGAPRIQPARPASKKSVFTAPPDDRSIPDSPREGDETPSPSIPADEPGRISAHTPKQTSLPSDPFRNSKDDSASTPSPLERDRRQYDSAFQSALRGAPIRPVPAGDDAVDPSLPPPAPYDEAVEPSPRISDGPVAGDAASDGDTGIVSFDGDRTIYYTPNYPPSERHWLPSGLLYKSYLAGEKEPRFALQTLQEKGRGMVWEVALGGRVGIYRWGRLGTDRPNGWQLDIEGASFVKLDLEQQQDVDAVDFRFGIPITYRNGRWAYKTGYYHISSHVGDEYMVKHPTFERINYVRDSFLFGASYDTTPDSRLYGEVAYAWQTSGGAEPLEFQFGGEYSPARSGGAPFAALNIHLREEFNFGGNVTAQAGWQWRGEDSQHLLRVGGMYFNGKSMQYSFFNQSEQLTGVGIWFDY